MRRPGTARAGTLLALALLAAAGPAVDPAAAQGGQEEARLLRDAGVQEAAGDLAGAEATLLGILDSRPASVPALLSMERILRVEARLEELVPLVRAGLEADPRSALLNGLLVRTYSALDRIPELEAATEAWIQEVPDLEVPYREVAQVWESRGDYDRARTVLERGRRAVGRPDALALELGDIYAALDDRHRAVQAWERAVGLEARGLSQVRRRLQAQPDGGAGMVAPLIELLAREPTTPHRVRAAADLAVDAGLQERAERLGRAVVDEMEPAEARSFLIDVARRADGAGLNRLAYWAYGALSASESEEGRLLAIRNRLAELALELGDTASAAANYEAVEAAYEEGTPQRRQAAALRIELMAQQEPGEAAAGLEAFRTEYPDGSENDRLSAAVAAALLEEGQTREAARLLAGVRGPRSALVRGRLELENGDVQAARLAYMTAAPELRGPEATQVLSLVTLLGRVSEYAGRTLGAAMRLQETEGAGPALDLLEGRLRTFRPEDRPPVLEFAATVAEADGLADDARRIRRAIVADFPQANEAPAALLALARGLRAEEGARAEARELLERLILEYPRSALVPQARRELQQMERAGAAESRGSRRSSGAA